MRKAPCPTCHDDYKSSGQLGQFSSIKSRKLPQQLTPLLCPLLPDSILQKFRTALHLASADGTYQLRCTLLDVNYRMSVSLCVSNVTAQSSSTSLSASRQLRELPLYM